MDDLKTLETKLNALIAKGEMIEAVEQFYADDCVYQEGNQPPRTGGKKAQEEHLSHLFKTVKTVNALTLHGQSIGDGITMSEWTFNLTTNNGPRLWNEVLRRRWQNGKVVSERYDGPMKLSSFGQASSIFSFYDEAASAKSNRPGHDVAPDCLKRSLPFGPRVAVKWKRKCNERF